MNSSLHSRQQEVTADNWLENAVSQGIAEITDNGGFKVNPGYYAELPKENRHYESICETQAVEVMAALSAADVAFSAVSRRDGKVSLTVANRDVTGLNDIMLVRLSGKILELRQFRRTAAKVKKRASKYQTVSSSITHHWRKSAFTKVEPMNAGRKIAAELQKRTFRSQRWCVKMILSP